MNKRFICGKCGNTDADLVEQDHGGYLEWWGSKVWHNQYVDVTECCLSEDYEEADDDEED